ncbi:TonB-dependent receptor [Litoribacter alkaliphilus]|uniref:TonB-dependent receptor n=1 Tax=Litoribacter ruber TaxID=702568 RepID=A0AAP2G3G6_9BACT|nr:TonB-dependent receptor [Litoribacter alkaliphilus]MBS9522981.1 TonB-dependent receptor [Litoribacter alkaliphilus]
MRGILLVVALIFAAVFQAFAQSEFKGTVLDKDDGEPVFGAYVFLKDKDGETLKSSVTDFDGSFSLGRPAQKEFYLEISYVGYQTLRKDLTSDSSGNLGEIQLINDGQLMEAFEFEAPVMAGEVKRDTVAFNASAYKTRPEADADELVRKMPGVIIQDGTIQVQGENVEEILVDGRPFFGDNPAAALKNLPAEVIEKIEFLDRIGDEAQLTGFDDGETVKTINIITKKGRRAGRFGKFYAGYGTGQNYMAGGNMNFFNEAQRFTILGLSNNINQQNFSSDEMAGAMANNNNRRGGNDMEVGQLPGITRTNAIGLNFSDEYQEGKLKVSGSYLFNHRDNVLNRNSNREYVLPNDSLQLYREDRNNRQEIESHRFNMRIDYDINEKHGLIIRPRASFDRANSINELVATNLVDNQTPISGSTNTTTSQRENFNFGNSLTYRFRFNKRGRTFSTNIYTGSFNNQNQSDLVAVNQNFINNNLDSLIQFSENTARGFNYNVNFSYTEPLGEKSQLRFNYRVRNNISSTAQQVLRQEPETSFIRLDSILSNNFENTYQTQSAGLGYRFNNEKLRVFANVRYQRADIDSDRTFPNFENTQRDFGNVLPRMVINYSFSDISNLRFDYNTNTNPPAIRQLQDVLDNSNPLQISNGNPNLNQEYSHRIFTRFRRINPETNRSFMVFFFGNLIQDFIGNETFIASEDTFIEGDVLLRQGGQFNRPVNLDNFWTTRTYVSYGFPLSFMKSNLNINSNFRINNRPGIINEQRNDNINTTLGQGFVLSSNISERVDFNISTNANYNMVRSSLQESLNNNFFEQRNRFDLFWNFAGGFFFSNNVNHLMYAGLGEDFDQNIWLWNMDFGFRFPPSRKAEIKLTVFDLLNQNVSINRNVTDVFVEDVRTQVLQQFVMLTFTYNLRRFGGVNMDL